MVPFVPSCMYHGGMVLPPGPRRPAAVQLAEWLTRRTSFMEECARRYGDIFTIRLPGLEALVFVHSPELNKQVFTGDPAVIHAGEASKIFEFLFGPSSLIVLDRDEHRSMRRLLSAPLHGERMEAHTQHIHEITQDIIQRWPLMKPFTIDADMQTITLRVILRAVFGVEGAQMNELGSLLSRLLNWAHSPIAFMPIFQRDFTLNPFHGFFRLRARIQQKLFEIFSERRQAEDLDARRDILSLLLITKDDNGSPLRDTDLMDQLITMLIAGHDTTATMLPWVFERLLSSGDATEKTLAELDGAMGDGFNAAALPRLEYLEAVIKEALRSRPIVAMIGRKLKSPLTLGGYRLPAETNVNPCIWLTHHRPDLYPDPERFRPERFLGGKIDPYAWLPFGGGVRRCIGMSFAMHEMKVILATVLSELRFRPSPRGAGGVKSKGALLVPAHGTRVVVTERRRAATRHVPARQAAG
jgi:cytochrome P450